MSPCPHAGTAAGGQGAPGEKAGGGSELDPRQHQVFEHRADDGTVRWFDVSAMRLHAQRTARYSLTPITSCVELICTDTSGLSPAWLRRTRGIEEPRLAALTAADLVDPVIMVEMSDGTHLLVDGHHRWVKRAERGDDSILAYRFPLGTWERFLLIST